jgi:hypothetical protein
MAQRENMTAVEWLEYLHREEILIKKSFEMAKQKEKEQIDNAWLNGFGKVIENEKYWNGFILGIFVGGILGIIAVRLVDNNIL